MNLFQTPQLGPTQSPYDNHFIDSNLGSKFVPNFDNNNNNTNLFDNIAFDNNHNNNNDQFGLQNNNLDANIPALFSTKSQSPSLIPFRSPSTPSIQSKFNHSNNNNNGSNNSFNINQNGHFIPNFDQIFDQHFGQNYDNNNNNYHDHFPQNFEHFVHHQNTHHNNNTSSSSSSHSTGNSTPLSSISTSSSSSSSPFYQSQSSLTPPLIPLSSSVQFLELNNQENNSILNNNNNNNTNFDFAPNYEQINQQSDTLQSSGDLSSSYSNHITMVQSIPQVTVQIREESSKKPKKAPKRSSNPTSDHNSVSPSNSNNSITTTSHYTDIPAQSNPKKQKLLQQTTSSSSQTQTAVPEGRKRGRKPAAELERDLALRLAKLEPLRVKEQYVQSQSTLFLLRIGLPSPDDWDGDVKTLEYSRTLDGHFKSIVENFIKNNNPIVENFVRNNPGKFFHKNNPDNPDNSDNSHNSHNSSINGNNDINNTNSDQNSSKLQPNMETQSIRSRKSSREDGCNTPSPHPVTGRSKKASTPLDKTPNHTTSDDESDQEPILQWNYLYWDHIMIAYELSDQFINSLRYRFQTDFRSKVLDEELYQRQTQIAQLYKESKSFEYINFYGIDDDGLGCNDKNNSQNNNLSISSPLSSPYHDIIHMQSSLLPQIPSLPLLKPHLYPIQPILPRIYFDQNCPKSDKIQIFLQALNQIQADITHNFFHPFSTRKLMFPPLLDPVVSISPTLLAPISKRAVALASKTVLISANCALNPDFYPQLNQNEKNDPNLNENIDKNDKNDKICANNQIESNNTPPNESQIIVPVVSSIISDNDIHYNNSSIHTTSPSSSQITQINHQSVPQNELVIQPIKKQRHSPHLHSNTSNRSNPKRSKNINIVHDSSGDLSACDEKNNDQNDKYVCLDAPIITLNNNNNNNNNIVDQYSPGKRSYSQIEGNNFDLHNFNGSFLINNYQQNNNCNNFEQNKIIFKKENSTVMSLESKSPRCDYSIDNFVLAPVDTNINDDYYDEKKEDNKHNKENKENKNLMNVLNLQNFQLEKLTKKTLCDIILHLQIETRSLLSLHDHNNNNPSSSESTPPSSNGSSPMYSPHDSPLLNSSGKIQNKNTTKINKMFDYSSVDNQKI
jgi:hypothetical protein